MDRYVVVSDFRADGPNRGQLFVPAETPEKAPVRRRIRPRSSLDRSADLARKKYHERVRDGLCVKCGAGNASGRARCPACDTKHRTLYLKRFRDRVRDGLCGECGKPQDRDRGLCRWCQDRKQKSSRDIRDKRASAGLCTRCGKPAVRGRRLCAFHRDWDNARRRAKR